MKIYDGKCAILNESAIPIKFYGMVAVEVNERCMAIFEEANGMIHVSKFLSVI